MRKLLSGLLSMILILGTVQVGASAQWRQNIDSSLSWIDDGHNIFSDGWKQINGKWYYFKQGKMQTGWLKYCNVAWYYLGSDGAMKTGWLKDGNAVYFLDDNGVLITDSVFCGLYFDSNGIAFLEDNKKVLVDNEYVKITYLGIDKYGPYYKKVELQVENKSEKELYIESSNVLVDGYEKNSWINLDVNKGQSLYTFIGFYKDDIKTNFDNINGNIVIKTFKDMAYLKEEGFTIKI
ncbi:cell wall-binding protein [Clostridium saccharoperbutylacetonicum]|uniref:cell wall-binding protein n=1 Tax=Clostridium saccharoperbutylacetonicum TaxID=36745 RepID=UPI000983A4B4|nr:cell wall-binding protein [Clostridium saccharoperbutylacetonicum]AQR95302.1 autolysin [Clostridium saccharoperbutylacetonicum]NSB31157.1 hypothetical protein [Clostridium saccharoperbutylacetonicum]